VEDGIVVDDRCRTSDPDIYAVGDCTFHPNALIGRSLRLESVHNALEQARTAAANACGEDLRYSDIPWFWSDQYDLKLQIAGLFHGYDHVAFRGVMADRAFAAFYYKGDKLIAVDAVNRPAEYLGAKMLIQTGRTLPPNVLEDMSRPMKELVASAR
jgi:3-phenylpropionate/trans-cinnamate dioxygenase ferredoxin reductase subunit